MLLLLLLLLLLCVLSLLVGVSVSIKRTWTRERETNGYTISKQASTVRVCKCARVQMYVCFGL